MNDDLSNNFHTANDTPKIVYVMEHRSFLKKVSDKIGGAILVFYGILCVILGICFLIVSATYANSIIIGAANFIDSIYVIAPLIIATIFICAAVAIFFKGKIIARNLVFIGVILCILWTTANFLIVALPRPDDSNFNCLYVPESCDWSPPCSANQCLQEEAFSQALSNMILCYVFGGLTLLFYPRTKVNDKP
ncbi:MAG: hypothetical protein FWG61_08800 [Firmicutes bacterium]|nr:hypothetical protein [Bacillota bacterium]